MKPQSTRGPQQRASSKQRGIAMVVVLMFLLVITGLALFSARYATLGEGMARNQLDSERARQAAESALRDAERDLQLPGGPALPTNAKCSRDDVRPVFTRYSAFTPTCTGGQCSTDEAVYTASKFGTTTNAEVWWNGGKWENDLTTKPTAVGVNCTFSGAVPLGTFTGAAPIAGVARQPEYLMEIISRGSGRLVFFRVTARGFGASDRTQVVLQTYFRPFIVQ